jgi:hypothetical protein
MNKHACLIAAAVICSLLTPFYSARAQATAFTYQGYLNAGDAPAGGSYDLAFTLYNAATNGQVLAGPVTNRAVAVSNGLFTTMVDLGNVFNGGSNWLELAVSTNGANAFITLVPRQTMTPVPMALYAGAASNLLGTVTASNVVSGISITNAFITNSAFAGDGAGLTNVPGTIAQAVVAGTTVAAQANTAYDLTNASPVTVNLPATGNVGDVIQVNGAGTGGWQVTGTTINGGVTIYNTWTESTTSGTTNRIWRSIASDASGNHLVAVVDGGGIWTSANNGVDWTQSDTAGTTSQNWVSVASDASGSNLVAVVIGGGIWTSTNNGVDWTQSSAVGTTSQNWVSVASDASGSNLVAMVIGGGIWTSTNNGVDWTQSDAAGTTSKNWRSVASDASGSNLVAVVSGGGIWTSTNNGVDWTQSSAVGTTGPSWVSVASDASGSNLVAAVSSGGIWTSTNNGVDWTQSSAAGTSSLYWFSVASDASGSNLVAAVYGGGGIWTSTNTGATWEQSSAPNTYWAGVAISANGAQIAGVEEGQRGDGGGIWYRNPDIMVLSGAAGSSQEFQYLGNGVWQALTPSSGNNGAGLTNVPNMLNYVYNFDTSTQTVATADTFADLTFNTNAQINGWTHTAGTATYTNGPAGLYLVEYTAEAVATNTVAATTVSVRALLNDVEIPGSQSVATPAVADQPFPLSRSFMVYIPTPATNIFKLQFTGSGVHTNRLASNLGSGTVKPDAALTIIRIQ